MKAKNAFLWLGLVGALMLPTAARADSSAETDSNSVGDRAAHDLSVSLSPLAVAGGAFLLLNNHRHAGEATGGFEGIAATGAATLFLKKAVNEERPGHNGVRGSFPSGHAALAFSLATSLSQYHPQYQWFAYGTAAAIGASRVEVDAHYWHDVFAGATVGYFATRHFLNHHLAFSPHGLGFLRQF